MTYRGLALLAFGLLSVVACSGCSTVKPWQKEILAQPGMQPDAEPALSATDDHIYFSREASKGGRSFGGGGCGCD